jgi:stage II sporulation protein D
MMEAVKTPVVKVGILSGSQVSFELRGAYMDEMNNSFSGGKYVACEQDGKIVLERDSKVVRASENILLMPSHPDTDSMSLSDVTIGIGFHWQKKETQVFRGGLKLISTPEGITAINIVPVEDYLISVISSEMKATSSLEMLKAHAVISRSWLLAQIEKSKDLIPEKTIYPSSACSDEEIVRWYDREDHRYFDVCADDHCQRYQGITRISTEIAEKAVRLTAGEVLMYDQKLCDTRFSKCCGGVTELFANAWEPVNHPYLQRVYDADAKQNTIPDLTREDNARAWILSDPPAFCNTTDEQALSQVLNDYDRSTHDFYRWKVTYKTDELGELIKSRTGIDFGTISDLVPIERGVSGRIIRLKIIGSKKTMIIGKELEIRKALSKTHLYSSAFVVEKVAEGFVLHGAGWGHGVGLCQIGAAVMGSKGYTYHQILAHYFCGAELKKKYGG